MFNSVLHTRCFLSYVFVYIVCVKVTQLLNFSDRLQHLVYDNVQRNPSGNRSLQKTTREHSELAISTLRQSSQCKQTHGNVVSVEYTTVPNVQRTINQQCMVLSAADLVTQLSECLNECRSTSVQTYLHITMEATCLQNSRPRLTTSTCNKYKQICR